jgi:hypothetical protein
VRVSSFQNKITISITTIVGTGCTVAVKALCCKLEGRGFDPIRCLLIYLIIPAAVGPRVYSASNINEYQKHKNNNVSGE